ncbi:MAG: transcription termination/antitermination factor NusG [Planctomycetes bacterium]|nr:transcription termination/antitermination factor NusG [Planctomycetota bacterium]
MGIVTVTDETVDITDQPEEVSEDVVPNQTDTAPEAEAANADGDAPADATSVAESEAPTDSDAESTEVEAASSEEEAEPDEEEDAEAEQIRHEGMDWYVLRVASNKEEQVRTTLERKVKIEALEHQIGQILVPTVKEKRMRGRQARVYHRKLYPGYVIVEMATEKDGSIPEDIWFMIKETTGVGDFIGSDGKPIKMEEHEVAAILAVALKSEEDVGLSGMSFKKGDPAKVTEGSFENFEGTIDSVDEGRGMVTVLLTIFGRSTPVEVEYWQVEKL